MRKFLQVFMLRVLFLEQHGFSQRTDVVAMEIIPQSTGWNCLVLFSFVVVEDDSPCHCSILTLPFVVFPVSQQGLP